MVCEGHSESLGIGLGVATYVATYVACLVCDILALAGSQPWPILLSGMAENGMLVLGVHM